MNDFDKLTAAQQHAKEIQSSRFGWFGGSDAKMLLDVYLKHRTFDTMSNTQRARFNMLMGWSVRYGGFDTPCIRGGHAFEDYMQDKITGLQNAQGINGTLAMISMLYFNATNESNPQWEKNSKDILNILRNLTLATTEPIFSLDYINQFAPKL